MSATSALFRKHVVERCVRCADIGADIAPTLGKMPTFADVADFFEPSRSRSRCLKKVGNVGRGSLFSSPDADLENVGDVGRHVCETPTSIA